MTPISIGNTVVIKYNVSVCDTLYASISFTVYECFQIMRLASYFEIFSKLWKYQNHPLVLITYENAVMLSRTWIFYWRIGSWKLLSKLDPMWQNTLIFKDEIALKFPIESAVRTRKWKKFQNTRITLILRDDLDLFELRVKHVDYFILYYLVSFTLVWFIFWFTRRILFISNFKN